MAKKTSIKVRLVPEQKQNSSFYYYVKKPTAGEKAKNKLKLKKYNPETKKHEWFIEKNYHHIANNYLYFILCNFIKELIIAFQIPVIMNFSIFNAFAFLHLKFNILFILF